MYQIRAAQIDLNRQKETMDFIKSYVDFIAANGYNTLVLYIAWRVKIESHPWPSEEEAYTAEEIREMVAYAKGKGLEVIPTTNLTYVTSLLKYDGMKKYLENGTRFWGSPRGNFCCSMPEVRDFIETYLAELASLVPSAYFHIGGDEAWDTGFCDRCKGEDFSFEKEQQLYLGFILDACEIVRHKLGRRVIMWDDMFEYYPEVLSKIPRDVIMAHWQYQPDCYRSVSHFGNRRREQTLAKYDAMGFDYLISPATYSTSNGRTISDFWGHGKRCLGGIMTIWRTHLRYLYQDLPTIAAIGRYWESGGEKDEATCFREALSDILDTRDEVLLDAMRTWTEKTYSKFSSLLSQGYLLNFNFNGMPYAVEANRRLQKAIIKNAIQRTKTLPGRRILEEISFCLEIESAAFELKETLHGMIYGARCDNTEALLMSHLDRIRHLGDSYSLQWERLRPGIKPNCIRQEFDRLLPQLEEIIKRVAKGDFIKVLFCLPNGYGAAWTKISIATEQGEALVAQGVFKGSPLEASYYERIFFLESDAAPKSLRIEVSGYGVQGVCHASAEINGKLYLPEKIVAAGQVDNPDFILDDDCKTCWLGEPDADKAWRYREVAEQISAVTIKLTEK